MPRRKMIKPTPHKIRGDKCIIVKYEKIGGRKVKEMMIPASEEITINSYLEPLIAKKLGCDTADVWLVDEPYMVVNRSNNDNEV
jgi:hypothetical protein